jgi:hypothetical protein
MTIAKHDFDQLMNQARVTLVGSSDAGLKGAFYDVCSEFLNDSSSWTQDVQVNAVPTRTEYPLQVNEGQVIRLVGVSTPPIPQGQQQDATTLPAGVFIPALMPTVGTLLLSQAPVSATTYIAQVVTNVALPTDRNAIPIGPDWLLPIWHVGLLDGLLGKMMMQPGKSYSDKVTGAYHLKRFRDVIARARVSKLRASTNGAQAWRFPQQFRSNTQRGGIPSTGSTNERTF